mgnify:CR=1 FL=1
MNGLGIIDTVLLPYKKNLPFAKIIASAEFDNNFALLVQESGQSWDNCTTYIYKVDGGTIIDTAVTSDKLSFSSSVAWDRYIASPKYFASSYPIP